MVLKMKWCRTDEAVIAFNLRHWLKNIPERSFILFFLKLLSWSFHTPFQSCHPHLTGHGLHKTRRALIPKSCFSHEITRPLQESFFFPSPARSARKDSHIPWPHISACWHFPLHLCYFRLLLDSWIDIFSLLSSSGKLWVYQWVKQWSALNLCCGSKNLKSWDSEKRDRCFPTSIYLSALSVNCKGSCTVQKILLPRQTLTRPF